MKINYFFLLPLFVCIFVGSSIFGMDERSKEVNSRLFYCVNGSRHNTTFDHMQEYIQEIENLLQEASIEYDQEILAQIFVYACRNGCENIVTLLIKLMDQKGELYRRGLSRACNGNCKNITKILLEAHEFNLLCTVDNCVMLTLLIKNLLYCKHDQHAIPEHIDCLLSYLRNRTDNVQWNEWIEEKDNYGGTILHTICDCHYPHKVAVAELFLSCGVDVDIKNSKGQTPLQTALLCNSACFNMFFEKEECVEKSAQDEIILRDTINLFLRYNANIHTVDRDGNGLLHALLSNNKLQWSLHNLQQLLKKNYINSIKSGVCPSVKNKRGGQTPLHSFIRSHCVQPTRSDIYTEFSWTPNEVLATLFVYGADLHAKKNDGDTLLHCAADYDFYEVVPMLLFHAQREEKHEALLKARSLDGARAVDMVMDDMSVDTIFGDIPAKDLFKKEFIHTQLGQQCMQDCARHRRDAVTAMTGSPSFYRYANNRAIGYK